MEFFLDVDGVILDFESTFMDFIRETYLPELPQGYLPTSWEMKDEALSKLDITEAWEGFMVSGRFEHLNLLADVVSFNQISSQSPVYLVTNLPEKHYSGRIANLAAHGLCFTSLHMGGHHDFGIEGYPTKPQVIERLRCQSKRLIFLDDHPENCRAVRSSFPTAEVYLMERSHNKGIQDEGWIRLQSWGEFAEKFVTNLS